MNSQHRKALIWLTFLICVTFAFLVYIIVTPLGPGFEHHRERLIASRLFALALVTHLIALVAIFRKQVYLLAKRFFDEPTHPINLAVARVVTFTVLLLYLRQGEALKFSELPEALRVAPGGVGWLIDYIPISRTIVMVSMIVMIASCSMAVIGLFTRTAAVLTVLIGLYVLGVPQLFGKVNHYHHLIWFPAILAISPCADVFSVDAFLAARRRPPGSVLPAVYPSRSYALPLRFIWMLLGIVYFFPGFAKWWVSGIDWALSENPIFQFYRKWAQLDGWTPSFRIDHYPFLYQASSLGTIIFELTFIVLIIHPITRILTAIGGILFHTSVYLIMRINFWTVPIFYLTFIDWAPIYEQIRRRSPYKPKIVEMPRTKFELPDHHSINVTRPSQTIAVAVIGLMLLIMNVIAAPLWKGRSWPFAAYPTFAGMVTQPELEEIQIAIVGPHGETTPVEAESIGRRIPSARWWGMIEQIVEMEPGHARDARLAALWGIMVQDAPTLRDASAVQFYRVTSSTIPEQRATGPIHRELLLELDNRLTR